MSRPVLLDLFCGAGGAGMGYHRAGFDVVGVDIEPQPRYPFEFHQADALEFVAKYGRDFSAVGASPPCQQYTGLRHRTGREYADLVAPTRNALRATGRPYVIENVERAPLLNAMRLCGTHFGLRGPCWDGAERWLQRHRLFESNVLLMSPGPCTCRGKLIAGVYGNGGGGSMTRGYKYHVAGARIAMGIEWMTGKELAQAIPPAYTEFIGRQVLAALDSAPETSRAA